MPRAKSLNTGQMNLIFDTDVDIPGVDAASNMEEVPSFIQLCKSIDSVRRRIFELKKDGMKLRVASDIKENREFIAEFEADLDDLMAKLELYYPVEFARITSRSKVAATR